MPSSAAATAHPRTVRAEPSFATLVHSEWIKLRTVRSTAGCLLTLTAVTIGISVLVAGNRNGDYPGPAPIEQLVTLSQIGLSLGQLAIVVLAATSIGGEYSTGMIRTSLAVVPWRKQWLAAKALVVAVVALVTGVVLSVASFAILCVMAPAVSGRVTPEVVRSVLGGGAYLTGLALLAFAAATVLRSSVGGIVTVSGMSFVLSPLLEFSSLGGVGRFLPSGLVQGNAGWAIMQPSAMSGSLAPWTGFAVLCAWVAVAMTAAVYALDKRDA